MKTLIFLLITASLFSLSCTTSSLSNTSQRKNVFLTMKMPSLQEVNKSYREGDGWIKLEHKIRWDKFAYCPNNKSTYTKMQYFERTIHPITKKTVYINFETSEERPWFDVPHGFGSIGFYKPNSHVSSYTTPDLKIVADWRFGKPIKIYEQIEKEEKTYQANSDNDALAKALVIGGLIIGGKLLYDAVQDDNSSDANKQSKNAVHPNRMTIGGVIDGVTNAPRRAAEKINRDSEEGGRKAAEKILENWKNR